jgi:hypothetical protein
MLAPDEALLVSLTLTDATWLVLRRDQCRLGCDVRVQYGGERRHPRCRRSVGVGQGVLLRGGALAAVPHWPVWTKATVQLTTGIFAELTKDPTIGRAEALRRAEMAMLDPSNPPEFAHPMTWAPFALAGEGGAGG